jgi:stage II sporulation protein D
MLLDAFVRLLRSCALLLLTGIFFNCDCTKARALDADGNLRIAIARSVKQAGISVRSPYKILTLYTEEELSRGDWLDTCAIYSKMTGVKLGDYDPMVYGVKIRAEHASSICVNDRYYRGEVDIIRCKDMTLLVINHVDIEDYLCSVLVGEISHRWPVEALKAQAIAARTYAVYQSRLNKDADYDLTGSVYSQVYQGSSVERNQASEAVKATEGMVLTYNGKIFPAYYHGACGGTTEDANELWGVKLVPLAGVRCNFCKDSPSFKWRNRIPLSVIASRLAANRMSVGRIRNIVPAGFNSSGRIHDLKIKGTKDTVVLDANRFRLFVGADLVRSTNFKVSLSGRNAVFNGYGWGHGVGLCQWGAHFMAKKGYTAEEILKFYYPGSEIARKYQT